mgnify:CR=1 FL=1
MFTLYSADFINAPSNCSYPHKFEVTDSANFARLCLRRVHEQLSQRR